MQNGGQTCISVERVYVEAPVYDDFVGRVTQKVRDLRQGPSEGPGSVDVGAVTFAPQMETIAGHVDAAREAGATVLTGGRAGDAAGRFYEPTVLVDVDHTMACMTEETFGPDPSRSCAWRTRRKRSASPTTPSSALPHPCGPRTPRAASRSRGASRPGRSA
jgi:hypothetical protein